ncbi:sensor histidine kinase [Microbacterium enclense]|uniref:sensor histidine kinase n=1 Tax=Microbacterium enclense TaxID=993073 RepID=UPI0013E28D42|nr:histidine kinase [Microbacterium enclense]
MEQVASPRVVALMRSPLFVGVVFVAIVVQVCGVPVLTLFSGGGTWDSALPPAVVVTLTVLACLAQAAALMLAASRPVPAMMATVVLYLIVAVALAVPNWASPMHLVIAMAMFALGTARPTSVAVAWAAFAVVGALVALASWAASLGAPAERVIGFLLTEGVSLASTSFAGVALGILWAVLERRAARARQRALDLEEEQAAAIERSRVAERGRIAQELHDVAGQHLAGLVSLCDATTELAPAHPEQALRLIEEVRAEGRYAAASLYGALGDLRAVEEVIHAPTPDLRDLDTLAGFWRERGMDVSVQVRGDLDLVPVVVSATAYRAVQEGLSNAAKHAAGASVEVDVIVDADRLRVRVSNDAASRARTDEAHLGLGWGLDGLREKFALMEGTVDATDDGTGGWRLSVDVPFAEVRESVRD